MRVTYESILSILEQYEREKGFLRRHNLRPSENPLISSIRECLPTDIEERRLHAVNDRVWFRLKALAQVCTQREEQIFLADVEKAKPASTRAFVRLFFLRIQEDSFEEYSAVQEAREWFGEAFAEEFSKHHDLSALPILNLSESSETTKSPSLSPEPDRLGLIEAALRQHWDAVSTEEKLELRIIKNLLRAYQETDSGKALYSSISFEDRDFKILANLIRPICFKPSGEIIIRDSSKTRALDELQELHLNALNRDYFRAGLVLLQLKNTGLFEALSPDWFCDSGRLLSALNHFPLRALKPEYAAFINQCEPRTFTDYWPCCLEKFEGIPFLDIPKSFLNETCFKTLTQIFELPFIVSYLKDFEYLSVEHLIQKSDVLKTYAEAGLFERIAPRHFFFILGQLWKAELPEIFLNKACVTAFGLEDIPDFESLTSQLKILTRSESFTRKDTLVLNTDILRLILRTLIYRSVPELGEMSILGFHLSEVLKQALRRDLQKLLSNTLEAKVGLLMESAIVV